MRSQQQLTHEALLRVFNPRVLGLAVSLTLLLGCSACSKSSSSSPNSVHHLEEDSHRRAVAIAEHVVAACGGRAAWASTRCIGWTDRLGLRHLWDRQTSDYRCDYPDMVVCMNLEGVEGFADRKSIDDPRIAPGSDEDKAIVERTRKLCQRESALFLLPISLMGGDMALECLEDEVLASGEVVDVISASDQSKSERTYRKFKLWVSRDTGLVKKWLCYRQVDDSQPIAGGEWSGWETHRGVLFSTRRGDGLTFTDIEVLADPPAGLTASGH
jgi:hypothetical protein